MKNYYDELEVSKTASKEVIEKVYKILAKKYHPDTTKEIDKQASEERFKRISVAYEILSDDKKRKEYDLELEQSSPSISYEEYMNVVKQRDYLNNVLNNLRNKSYDFNNLNNINREYYNNQTQYNRMHTNTNTNNTYNNYQNNTYNKQQTNNFTSIFAYYRQRLKEFFSTVGLLLISIVVALLIINLLSTFNLFII